MMAMLKNYLSMLVLGAAVLALPACSDDDDPVSPPIGEEHPYADDIVENGVVLYGPIQGDRTFSADSVYYLDGYVFVENGELTIEPGTVIMGFEVPSNQISQWTDENGNKSTGQSSTLIITREATINAAGTMENPIVFTSAEDEEALGGTPNLGPSDSKLWAGVIILGKAPVYSNGATEVQIEGIPDNEDRAIYGGTEANHSSGLLTYVSIRFTGAELTGDGDEIQGLTLGGVGSGTTIEYIDIFVSGDDGVEIFGGTVNIKNLSVAFAEDDALDFDLGWDGFGQYLFGIQRSNAGDHGGEWDGASPEDAPLYTTARLYNVTLIGQGASGTREAGSPAMLIREGGALSIYNSIITDFNGKGIEVQDSGNPESSYNRIVNEGESEIAGNTWWTLNAASIAEMVVPTAPDDGLNPSDPDASDLIAYLEEDNTFEDPMLTGITRENESGGLDPRAAGPGNPVGVSEAGVDNTDYAGAFDPDAETWLAGWSTLAKFGILAE